MKQALEMICADKLQIVNGSGLSHLVVANFSNVGCM